MQRAKRSPEQRERDYGKVDAFPRVAKRACVVATTCQDQAGKTSTSDGAGHRNIRHNGRIDADAATRTVGRRTHITSLEHAGGWRHEDIAGGATCANATTRNCFVDDESARTVFLV
jgi:hypothetical protein